MYASVMIDTSEDCVICDIIERLRSTPGIVSISLGGTDHDVLCTIEASDVLELETITARYVREIEGVVRTVMHLHFQKDGALRCTERKQPAINMRIGGEILSGTDASKPYQFINRLAGKNAT